MTHRIRQLVLAILIIGLASPGLPALAQQRPYRVNDRQVNQLLQRIEMRTATFRQSLNLALDRSRLDNTRQEENVTEFVQNFEAVTNRLRDNFRARQDVAADVQEMLNRASFIDRFMQRHRLSAQVQRDWNTLRSDLNLLASYYNVTWRWETQGSLSPSQGSLGQINFIANRLTGTYRLDVTRSDNAQTVADRAVRGLSWQEQQRVRERILRRLEAPETLAIEQRGRNVTIASSLAAQVTLEADGREHLEMTNNGRQIRANVSLQGDQLMVNRLGDRGNDYRATFVPIDGGSRLRVTRSLDIEGLAQPVMVTSIYNRTSDVAQLNLYSDNSNLVRASGSYRGNFVVPSGTELVAVLNSNLSTRQTSDGERFSLTVRSPRSYEGAVIEGYVSQVDRSGRLTGRPEMSLNFERIRMRDGRTYEFTGYIENVRTIDGQDVRVDSEGTVRERSGQTERTLTRGGIGAAVGALIGALAGGGKGAAIGAAVGAGAGAGSVFVQGRDDLDLASGTEFMIRASAPI